MPYLYDVKPTLRTVLWILGGGLAIGAWSLSPLSPLKKIVGPQPDGTFIVSTGQRIMAGTIAFPQRLSEIALHPFDNVCAVVAKNKVFLIKDGQIVPGSDVPLGSSAGFHGAVWTPDGKRFYSTTEEGHLQVFAYAGGKLTPTDKVDLKEPGSKRNPVPGGMCVDRAGKSLFVACTDLGEVVEVDLATNRRVRDFETQVLPFTVRLSEDESKLVVTNWGGEAPDEDDAQDTSGTVSVKVTPEGSAATGTVSLVNRATGKSANLLVGIHPTGIAVQKNLAYIANSMSDSISVVDIEREKVIKTIEFKFRGKRIIGAMPNDLFVRDRTLYACNGGDNALCEIDLKAGSVRGYRPAGFFPIASQLSRDGRTAYVVNSKGNGSVRVTTTGGNRRNTHDFQGTVSVIDLGKNLRQESDVVAQFNNWNDSAKKPNLKVYKGAIKHVIYVIKENRTYDEIFGDMPIGDGDASLCSLGERVMPNHRKLAREFGLFDNAYTCGTNSADGHQWCDQAMANDYLEHFYVGYSRTYPDDGEDAMALNSTGRIWDAALKAGKSVRVYGEWAGDEQATFEPRPPKDWFEAWEDRQSGRNLFRFKAHTRVGSLKPILCPDYHYWPLIQSDQSRIDVFEREFKAYVSQGNLPNLMVMSLPSDHSEGLSTTYPSPPSMMADNDLALGRLVELVSKSPVWKETAIFVTQDDSQGGPDHVDGHRSVCLVVSPYSKRGAVNSEFTTQLRTLRTIEDMLGIKPMCKFDTIARPMTECFTDQADLTPYRLTKNNVPLGERNPSPDKMTVLDKYWYDKSVALDFSGVDRADWYWLNRIVWYSVHKGKSDYPGMPWDRPGLADLD